MNCFIKKNEISWSNFSSFNDFISIITRLLRYLLTKAEGVLGGVELKKNIQG